MHDDQFTRHEEDWNSDGSLKFEQNNPGDVALSCIVENVDPVFLVIPGKSGYINFCCFDFDHFKIGTELDQTMGVTL